MLKNQVSVIDNTLKGLPESHVSRRIQERKNSNYKEKQTRLLEIIKQKADLQTSLISIDENLNPVSSIAKILKDKRTKYYFDIHFILGFDP